MSRNTYHLYKYCGLQKSHNQFEKYLLLDFEATCTRDEILKPQEIIEFPCLNVCGRSFKIQSKFHRYIKPCVNPILTPFCTELTGITQDIIDNQLEFASVFTDFRKWLNVDVNPISENKAIFVTCGNWDLKYMLPQQCKLNNIEIPSLMHRWINLKTAFFKATGYYPRSLKDMFSYFQISMVGRAHSGIDDCLNMLTIIRYLAETGYTFVQTDNL